jgi:hypothetical protein
VLFFGGAEGVVAGLVVSVEAVAGLVVSFVASDDVSLFDGRFVRSFVCFGFELTGAAYVGGVFSARFRTGAPASPSVERTGRGRRVGADGSGQTGRGGSSARAGVASRRRP